MAHVSSNQYGQSFASFIKAVFFFAIIQDQMKEVIEAWSRFVHSYKLDMQVSVVTEMEILVTHRPHGWALDASLDNFFHLNKVLLCLFTYV